MIASDRGVFMTCQRLERFQTNKSLMSVNLPEPHPSQEHSRDHDHPIPEGRIGLITPKHLVKLTKNSLQASGQLDKKLKICPASERFDLRYIVGDPMRTQMESFYIPTTLWVGAQSRSEAALRDLLALVGLAEHEAEISIVSSSEPDRVGSRAALGNINGGHSQSKPLARTISQWLATTQRSMPETARRKVVGLRWAYTVYSPLLLIPAPDFAVLKAELDASGLSCELSTLYITLCQIFAVTHIALNAPIPTILKKRPSIEGEDADQQVLNNVNPPALNILRSPIGLVPLHGDFGPALPIDHHPTAQDFDSAFWCTTRQNRIFQTWAPSYTMFSRGNVKEKARILGLVSLTEQRLQQRVEEASAVDLFAGIGYFAFSYVKAGVAKVLCWEINPWSVEGLKRGAEGNKWAVQRIEEGEAINMEHHLHSKIIVFEESNVYAARRIAQIRNLTPKVTHVNCGYLPSSKDSWQTAVQVLDPAGGWIHAHENIARKDVESRKAEIVEIFRELARKRSGSDARCEHLEVVKSYAPGVVHCVLDIAISPFHFT